MYPTIKDFMKEYNPNRQTIIASEPEKCFFGNSPTLAILNNVYGNNAAAALLFIRGKRASFITHIKQKRRDG